MTGEDAKRAADCVRDCSLPLDSFLKWGHLEKVSVNSPAHRLEKAGIAFERQFRVPLTDEDGTVLDDHIADPLLEQGMILEIKACESLIPTHTAQVLGHLHATGVLHGMLVNFGTPTPRSSSESSIFHPPLVPFVPLVAKSP